MSSRLRRQVPIAVRLGLALLAAAALIACGKKGPPEPPLRFVPAPAKDLKVSQQGYRLLLDMPYPKLTPGGQALGGVTEVEVWEVKRPAAAAAAATTPTQTTTPTTTRTTPPAPPTTPPTPSAAAAAPSPAPTAPAAPTPAAAPGTPAAPAAPAAPAGPQPLDPRELKAATQVLKLKGPEVGAATLGDRIVVALPLPEPLPEKPELRYYAVRLSGPHGDLSEYSNQAIILPRTPPTPPAETQVKPRGDGVEVTWTAPAAVTTSAAPALPSIVGYNVYRRDSQVKGFGAPLHAAAVGDRTFIDTTARFGQSYIYVVTTVAARGPLIESAIKSEVEIKYVDRFPPPVPSEPVALVEAGRVRLVWRASDAPDLAGYRVYRLDLRQVKGEYQRLTETAIPDVQFSDPSVTPGVTYVYRITAIDQSGNESDPAEVRATAQ